MEILDQLEKGDIGVEEAVKRLGGEAEAERSGDGRRPAGWMEWWWLVPFSLGLAFTALGGWLASLGGGWWVGAVPALLIGIPVMTLAAASRDSPWVYLRYLDRRRGRGARVFLGLPVPVGLAAGVLRVVGPWIRGLEATAVDEFLQALDGSLSRDRPLVVEVSESDEGERVVVSFG
jgi:hypothetical protein